jgi:hypothetical protein
MADVSAISSQMTVDIILINGSSMTHISDIRVEARDSDD